MDVVRELAEPTPRSSRAPRARCSGRPATWTCSRPSARSSRRAGRRTSRSWSTSPGVRGRERERPTACRRSSRRSRSTPIRTTGRRRRGRVTLMTLHNAKGLEYPVVFIIGLRGGGVPPPARARRARAGGGAAALLRRHHPGPAGADLTSPGAARCSAPAISAWPSRFISEIPDELTDREQQAARRTRATPRPRDLLGVSRLSNWLADSASRRSIAYRLGDDVAHPKFGEGVVTGIEPGGIVVIHFSLRRNRSQAGGRPGADQQALIKWPRHLETPSTSERLAMIQRDSRSVRQGRQS